MSPHGTPGADIYRWVGHIADELGVDPDLVDVEGVLDLAREVAAGVGRPAVPLTSFIAGCAVGAGVLTTDGGRAAFSEVAARVAEQARAWSPEGPA
jgi:hypothetical protein